MAVNVKGTWLATRAVAPLMKEKGYGKIVNVSSTVAYIGPPLLLHYVASKGAVMAMTRALANELGPKGIRVNLVAAGPLGTMAAKSIPGFEVVRDSWAERAPLGWDIADPAPTAKTVCALLSDWLPATTGTMVWADGGVSAMGQ